MSQAGLNVAQPTNQQRHELLTMNKEPSRLSSSLVVIKEKNNNQKQKIKWYASTTVSDHLYNIY